MEREFMKISVCIAVYNGSKYIIEQLDSILKQLNDDDEIILSDDCSQDNTLEIVRKVNDKRIVILENKGFGSPILNFEKALLHANGDIIFLSDQDDVWLPNKVELYLEKLKTCDFVYSNIILVDQYLNKINKLFYKKLPKANYFSIIFSNKIVGATIAIRKDLLKKAIPFPQKIPMHDQWLGFIALVYGRVEFIETPLLLYRRHSENASFCSEKSKNTLYVKIMFRVNFIRSIISYYCNFK